MCSLYTQMLNSTSLYRFLSLTRSTIGCIEQLKRQASSPQIRNCSIKARSLVLDFIGDLIVVLCDGESCGAYFLSVYRAISGPSSNL